MGRSRFLSSPMSSRCCVVLFAFLSFCTQTLATQWIQYTGNEGTVWLDNNRRPSLFTQDYGDCQGDSLINVTRFDAAYYKDNQTVLFHLGGTTALANESLMMYIGVYAYGESRFNLTFNPCAANIDSLCPINASVPVEASGIIPISPSDVAGIPPLALTIPDFEGQAILRLFANSTQSQIACYAATLSNGQSFSHPTAIGSTVGVFVAVAFFSSLATAIYGQSVPETRTHYAHSVSVLVVFSVLQHVFFTGALSMNFPSALVAFWSNFGWASGMIHARSMQNTINQFIGSNRGNISMVGAAPSGEYASNLGGGYSLTSIYKRDVGSVFHYYEGFGTLQPRNIERALTRRDLVNSTTGFSWYGNPVAPGLPLPGNYSGFAGTLGQLDIPASNAFLTGFLWFLVLLACLVAGVVVLKCVLEALAAVKLVKTDRLNFFRTHWIYVTGVMVIRACFIAFFMLMFLTMFQFTLGGATGVKAIAAIVFVLVLVGMMAIAAYALWYRLRSETFHNDKDRLHLKSARHGFIPSYNVTLESTATEKGDPRPTVSSVAWRRLHFVDPADRPHVHDDDDYTIRFGWLAARFRRSKWWFFSCWLAYEFVRACFYGGAAGHPMTQVFGLLAWEIMALVAIVYMRPFESSRLNLLMVYFLGFSKVATVALSSAFDPRFGLSRILTTVIGIVIIVIQGILTICLLVAIVVGAATSWMSIRRYQEDFSPKSWTNRRIRYFAHIEQKATDKPAPPPRVVTPEPEPEDPKEPKEPYFAVSTVRRQPKIEDDDAENDNTERPDALEGSRISLDPEGPQGARRQSRAQSVRSRTSMSNLPYGARRHRASWSTRDFQEGGPNQELVPSGVQPRMSVDSIRDTPSRHRAASMRGPRGELQSPPLSARNSADMLSNPNRSRRSISQSHVVTSTVEEDADIISPVERSK